MEILFYLNFCNLVLPPNNQVRTLSNDCSSLILSWITHAGEYFDYLGHHQNGSQVCTPGYMFSVHSAPRVCHELRIVFMRMNPQRVPEKDKGNCHPNTVVSKRWVWSKTNCEDQETLVIHYVIELEVNHI